MVEKLTILLIDDEIGEKDTPHQRAFVRANAKLPMEFRFSSARTEEGFSVDAAMKSITGEGVPDIVLLDLQFGESGNLLGLEILREITGRHPDLPVLVLSGLARDVSILGLCLEEGAIGFVEKSAGSAYLKKAVVRALEMAHAHLLIGRSRAMRDLRRQAARLSPYDKIPVMIVGERGTGKERVARYIHHSGPRSEMPFIGVNCAAIPETQIESEFFGAEMGSYAGAILQREGLLQRAHGAVLFLDEIGNIPLDTQAKLLRVLQHGTFRRIGSPKEEVKADFQLICATNVDPEELLRTERLREDFFDRIAAVTVRTPPLREWKADIPELAEHFLRQLGLSGEKRLSADVLDTFAAFEWPGNVRQLQRAIQEAVERSGDSEEITEDQLPAFLRRETETARAKGAVTNGLRLPEDSAAWPEARLMAEVELALAAKRRVQAYKGRQWKAEFMRLMYPHCKAASAKGFDDLIKRLSQGPWGDPSLPQNGRIQSLFDELRSP